MFDFLNSKDPESKKIWQELRAKELDWCCRMIQQIPFHNLGITLVLPDGTTCSYLIHFCPKCGRRLVEEKA